MMTLNVYGNLKIIQEAIGLGTKSEQDQGFFCYFDKTTPLNLKNLQRYLPGIVIEHLMPGANARHNFNKITHKGLREEISNRILSKAHNILEKKIPTYICIDLNDVCPQKRWKIDFTLAIVLAWCNIDNEKFPKGPPRLEIFNHEGKRRYGYHTSHWDGWYFLARNDSRVNPGDNWA